MRIGHIGQMVMGMVVALVMLAACIGPDTAVSGTPADGPVTPTGTLDVLAVAGPTCPVERQPPDPSCQPRPVAGAQVVVTPADGREILIAQGVTDDQGILVLDVAPGEYLVSASEVEGLFGRPSSAPVTVVGRQTTQVRLEYDTGIR